MRCNEPSGRHESQASADKLGGKRSSAGSVKINSDQAGRTASQESFFSTHLHICFKRELFRLGCAIAALDKNFNYSSVKDKNIISVSSTSAHPSKSMEQQSDDRVNMGEEYNVLW